MKNLLLTIAFIVILISTIQAQVQNLVNFNSTSDLTTLFNPDATPVFTNISDQGIGNTGTINVPLGSSDIWTTKSGYSVSGDGDIYTLSAFFKIQYNSGYGGLGFSANDQNESDEYGSPPYGLGMCFHGGGGMFINNRVQTAVAWWGVSGDLLIGNWYKMILKVTANGSNLFDMNFQIWNSDADGVLGTKFTEQTLNNVSNTQVGSATTLHVYFSAAGSRMEKIDNFEINLEGGSVIVEEGEPVLTTDAVSSITTTTATGGGNVTDDRSSAVTVRGVCWSTSTGPTTALSTKTSDGTGIGVFTSSLTGLVASTTYYVRAYATNGVGTSYGAEVSFTTEALPVYVKYNASGSSNGTSWANAYTSLQSALDAAVSGNRIWVAKGTYKPSSAYDLTNTSRYYHFRMVEGVSIYGGFAGTETEVSQRTDFAAGGANETILSGDIGTSDDLMDNCYHIFYHPNSYGLTSSAVLNGFTIKYGYADDNTGASHLYRGGGMYNGSGNQPAIDQCSFINNYAGNGGGLYIITSSPSISNSVFSNNTAFNLGGGMYITTSSNPAITNCLIINNNAVATGGGIYSYATDFAIDACNPVITNTTIANNSANLCGGIRVLFSTTTLNNCIIWGNTDLNVGAGNQIYMSGTGSSTTINYSCYSNDVNDIYGTLTTSNCITTDPQFYKPYIDDFRIPFSSPSKNTGQSSLNSEQYDIRGEVRAQGVIDMGAYEYTTGTDPDLPFLVTPSSGSGTIGDPYQIATLQNLTWIAASDTDVPTPNQATRWAAYYIQTADIDASSTSTWNSGQGWTPIGNSSPYFTGTYNGNGHTIDGLYINRAAVSVMGLFGTAIGGTITNLGVINVNITGGHNTAALEGNGSATISNCYSTGTIIGAQYTGGLVGQGSNVSNSYSTCSVTGIAASGGLIGRGTGTIQNCYSTGNVTRKSGYGSTDIGGFIGAGAATIKYCFSTGSVIYTDATNPTTNGFVGTNNSGTYIANFFDQTTSVQTSGTGATGKTTAEMKTNTTFLSAGWDDTIWNMEAGTNNGYPYLDWQNPTGTPLPVELSSFSASVIGSIVKLNWNTVTEINNYGFEIERKVSSSQSTVGNYEKIGFINGNGNSNSTKSYSYEDKNVLAGKYSYRLKQIDNDGLFEYSKTIEVDMNCVNKYELTQNYPNPFNPTTRIRYAIDSRQFVSLKVFNLLGKEVATLVNDYREAGSYEINFNASYLSSGVYIYKLQAGSFNQTKKMTLLK